MSKIFPTIHIADLWIWFCICFALLLLATYIMGRLGKAFKTYDIVERKFSILDLEFASSPYEISNTISGIFKLPDNKIPKVVRALRWQIIIDFILFMPAVYSAIFLLCMNISARAHNGWVVRIFAVLAWLQAIAFILDAIENFYLLRKIKKDVKPSTPGVHKAYQLLEFCKWGFALVAFIAAMSTYLHYWVSGFYSRRTIWYVGIITAMLLLFFILSTVTGKKTKKKVKQAIS